MKLMDHTVRETVLAMPAVFFGAIGLLLAVLDLWAVRLHSASASARDWNSDGPWRGPGGIAIRITRQAFARAVLGMLVGFAFGLASAMHIQNPSFGCFADDKSAVV